MTGCPTGKKRFANDDEAQDALARIRKKPRSDVVPVRFYPCTFCNGLHLTKSPDKGGREREIILKKEFERYLKK